MSIGHQAGWGRVGPIVPSQDHHQSQPHHRQHHHHHHAGMRESRAERLARHERMSRSHGFLNPAYRRTLRSHQAGSSSSGPTHHTAIHRVATRALRSAHLRTASAQPASLELAPHLPTFFSVHMEGDAAHRGRRFEYSTSYSVHGSELQLVELNELVHSAATDNTSPTTPTANAGERQYRFSFVLRPTPDSDQYSLALRYARPVGTAGSGGHSAPLTGGSPGSMRCLFQTVTTPPHFHWGQISDPRIRGLLSFFSVIGHMNFWTQLVKQPLTIDFVTWLLQRRDQWHSAPNSIPDDPLGEYRQAWGGR